MILFFISAIVQFFIAVAIIIFVLMSIGLFLKGVDHCIETILYTSIKDLHPRNIIKNIKNKVAKL